MATADGHLGNTGRCLESGGANVGVLGVLELAVGRALGDIAVPGIAQLARVSGLRDLQRLAEKDALAVGQLRHVLAGLLDLPAGGRL